MKNYLKNIITLFIATLFISGISAQTISYKKYIIGDIGYSTRSFNYYPVLAGAGGIERVKENSSFTPFAEIGIRAHTDHTNIFYGHLSPGLQYKNFIAITAGMVWGDAQPKQDRHILPNGEIEYLAKGAASSQFIKPQVAIRGMQPVYLFGDEEINFILVEQITYCNKVTFFSLGFKTDL